MAVHNWRLTPPPGVRFTPRGGNDVDLEIPEERLAEVIDWLGDNYQALRQAVTGQEVIPALPPLSTKASDPGPSEGSVSPAQQFNPTMFANSPMQPPPVGHGFAGAPPAAPGAQAQQQFSPFAIQPPAAAGGSAGFLASQPPIAPPPPPHGTQAAPAHPMQTASGVPILPQPRIASPPRPPMVVDPRAGIPNGVEPAQALGQVVHGGQGRVGRLGSRSVAEIQAARTAQERSLAALPEPAQATFGGPVPGGGPSAVPVQTSGPVPSNGIDLVQVGVDHNGRPVYEGRATGEGVAVLPQPGILAPPPPPAGPPAAPEEFIPVRGADLGGCRGCNGYGVRFNARDFGRERPLKCLECNGSGASGPSLDDSESARRAPAAGPGQLQLTPPSNGHTKTLDSGGAASAATDESSPPAQ